MGGSAASPPGVLVNANAGRVRSHPELLGRLSALVPEEYLRVTRSADEVAGALKGLRDQGIEGLAIVGGDGTVTGSLTALLATWPLEALPRIALLPGGSVNTIPRAFSGGAYPDRTLRRLLEQRGAAYEIERPPLRVRVPGAPDRYGFIFGNGAVTRFLDLYHAQPHRGVAGATSTFARALSSIAVNGTLARGLFERFAAQVEIDGEVAVQRRFSAMAAGGVRSIGLGFRPFHLAGTRPGRFHWIMTDAGPFELGIEIPAARYGYRNPGTRLVDACAARVVLHSRALPYTVDGDIFPATPDLEVAAGPPLRIWVP